MSSNKFCNVYSIIEIRGGRVHVPGTVLLMYRDFWSLLINLIKQIMFDVSLDIIIHVSPVMKCSGSFES